MSRSSKPIATKAPASHQADAPELSATATSSSTPRSRPRSGAASASEAFAARPFSSSNLSASIANARFKTFQVQYEILSKNPVLSAIAKEIPWKNLLDLFLLKFYAVGDVLWLQDEQPHEMAFVLCGGFLARHMDRVPEPVDITTNQSYGFAGTGAQPVNRSLGTILAEKMVKPGGSLAALTVHTNAHMQYSVVTAKFKSIVLSLHTGKYKSILRQLTPELRALVEHLLYNTENKLLSALKMRPIAPPKDNNSKQQQRSSRDKHSHKHSSSPSKKNQPATSLQRAASTLALNSISSSLQSSATMSLDATASWASLQVAKPVEYEVNSSLLILHQPSSSSTGNLFHHLVPLMAGVAASSTTKRSAGAAGALLHLSSAARLTAKKHTQRRLQSIKLPNPLEAFPPQPKNMGLADSPDLVDQAMLALLSDTSGGNKRAAHLDVVPKVHVGRLLKPLRKPAILSDDTEFDTKSSSSNNNSRTGKRGAGVRPHTVAQEQVHSSQQHVLVADRTEPFRDL